MPESGRVSERLLLRLRLSHLLAIASASALRECASVLPFPAPSDLVHQAKQQRRKLPIFHPPIQVDDVRDEVVHVEVAKSKVRRVGSIKAISFRLRKHFHSKTALQAVWSCPPYRANSKQYVESKVQPSKSSPRSWGSSQRMS